MPVRIHLGDHVVFEKVYRAYYTALCFFAAKYVGHDECEDIIEGVFIRLWKQQKEFASTTHLQASLYLSVKNACLDFIKVKARKDKRHEIAAQRLGQIEQDYLNHMIRTEVIAEIYRAINNLPSQCGKVVYMSLIEGLDNQEIAAVLDISVQTVKNRKSRALKALKQQFTDNIPALIMLAAILS